MVHYNVKMIERYMKQNQMSKSCFCDFCGEPLDTVDRMYQRDDDIPTIDTIKVAIALDVRLNNFLHM